MPADLCTKVNAIATVIVNTLLEAGQLIYSGFVTWGTFLINLDEAIRGRVNQALAKSLTRWGGVLTIFVNQRVEVAVDILQAARFIGDSWYPRAC
ncbi:MAG: hypothetical protein V3U52_05160 [Thermoplasmata archaeon]